MVRLSVVARLGELIPTWEDLDWHAQSCIIWDIEERMEHSNVKSDLFVQNYVISVQHFLKRTEDDTPESIWEMWGLLLKNLNQ